MTDPGEGEGGSLTCPYCGEPFEPLIAFEEGEGETIQDCEVCCRPVTIRFRFEGEELAECRLLSEDEG